MTAAAIAAVARAWSGDMGKPWGRHRPAVWFVVVLLVPPVGLVLFCIAAIKQLRVARQRAEDELIR